MQTTNQQLPEQGFNIPINKILLYLLLASLSFLFLGVTISYLYQKVQEGLEPIRLPWIFIVNTGLLLTSSYFMVKAKQAYRADRTDRYTLMLVGALIVTIGFMVMQYVGWTLMIKKGMLLASNPGTSYLYLISGLHLFHIVGGLPFLLIFIYNARVKMKEPLSVLIYFSDPAKKLKLDLLTIYWHFLDILWIYLVLFFLLVNLF